MLAIFLKALEKKEKYPEAYSAAMNSRDVTSREKHSPTDRQNEQNNESEMTSSSASDRSLARSAHSAGGRTGIARAPGE
jgi:hypothetical protein